MASILTHWWHVASLLAHWDTCALCRVCCVLVNVAMSVAQVVTVPLCLVGWCWSVGWGVSLVNIASQ